MNEIFKILEGNARASYDEIAAMTEQSPEQVEEIVRGAENDGTIVKYKTLVNWQKLAEEQVWALIEVKVAPQRDVGFDAIAERIYRFPEARFVYLMSGTFDLAVMVVGPTMQEVASFVSQKLAPLEGVQGTVTHFILKRYKEDGEILAENGESKRLPFAY